MNTEPDFALLFEPVAIGPVVARNRFYQVPHCTGLGYANPHAEAALRATKAEGGWAVVCTQEVEIHPSSEITPYLEGRLWDDGDIPAHRLMTEAVHAHGSLAGIELVHNGQHAANLRSRVPPMGPSHRPVDAYHPVQSRAMDRADIAAFKQWHVAAARRARQAGYDIIYVYAGHDMATLMHFLSPRYNDRVDLYGGSVRNRARLLEETLMDVRDAVGSQCAVALRLAVDELLGDQGIQASDEGAEIVSLLADIPDLWDVNISSWSNDSASARFEPDEGYQEPYTAFVKKLVTKPVVGVGRFTSASAMLGQIHRGVMDFIGAARPSIADPFLPNKIRDGDFDSIRECIGCNICISSDNVVAPIRCTQNPTMGEEWKRNWHPEKSPVTSHAQQTLVVGAGPAGLECALQLSHRGYPVILAEAGALMGGRLLAESKLPGMASYKRVSDYRLQQLKTSPEVELLLDNRLNVSDIVTSEIKHVFIATGSTWCQDARGRQHPAGLHLCSDSVPVFTPDDIHAQRLPAGHVVIYDDDHYYLASALAEYLIAVGNAVTIVTPASCIAIWTENTLEQHRIQSQLLSLGATISVSHALHKTTSGEVHIECVYSGRCTCIAADALLLVTSRLPERQLYDELMQDSNIQKQTLSTLQLIGDCLAPSTVASAVYSGHLAARSLHGNEQQHLYRREQPVPLKFQSTDTS